jgi:hypothetical protein
MRPLYELWGFAFAYSNALRITAYAFPHWFVVLLFTTLAAAPWLFKICWRFSLRTLLIATTLVAVVLGLIVWLQ